MEQKFEFKGNLVRMKTDESEQYWFAGIDVCNILGLENPTQSVESLDEDEKKLGTAGSGCGDFGRRLSGMWKEGSLRPLG